MTLEVPGGPKPITWSSRAGPEAQNTVGQALGSWL